jgi:hypothetical protein
LRKPGLFAFPPLTGDFFIAIRTGAVDMNRMFNFVAKLFRPDSALADFQPAAISVKKVMSG